MEQMPERLLFGMRETREKIEINQEKMDSKLKEMKASQAGCLARRDGVLSVTRERQIQKK
jgi:hypothetical protein